MEYMPKVLQAVAGENFTIYLYFSDGSVRLYDAKPILERGGVFEPMRDENFFREHLTVLNDTAAWDVNGDLTRAAASTSTPSNYMSLLWSQPTHWKLHHKKSPPPAG